MFLRVTSRVTDQKKTAKTRMGIYKNITSTKVQKAYYKRDLHLWLKIRLFSVYAAVFQGMDQRCKKRETSLP